jgi:hypothetical protein
MISKIPILMKNGYTLILQRLEFLYASLYEVFNQAYKDITTISRYCNIQIAGTKQLCKVHEDFKVIILQSQDENIFDKYDQNIEKQLPAPMLNRFEKQVILKGDIMSQSDLNCKSVIEAKLKRPFLSDTGKNGLKLESIIANYSEETLCSILLSKRENVDLWEEAKFNVKENQYREEGLGVDAAAVKRFIEKITALFSQAYMLLWTAEILAPGSPDVD